MLMAGNVPTGQEISKMSDEEVMKWAKFVLSPSNATDDILKLKEAINKGEIRLF